ncbi:myotubularin-related protein 14 isoform X2 [Candoia aspera]|uniref:myotubularin-related protein 14 isoform X2 n=1 Tax=Candoia aspera TaxID=51853 RepID=UPI002FD8654F
MASARGGSACLQAAGSGERALGELLLEFSRAQYRARESGGAAGGSGSAGSASSNKVEHIEKCCLELFSRDYCYNLIHNVNGEICSHYPRLIVILEYESSDRERHTFESTIQIGKLQDLIHRSKMARCRGRFVCPVILYKGKHICRSATLAGWGELYGRTGYNYIFSGGSDDAWADTEDLSEEDSAFRNADSQLFDKVRGHDIKLLRYLSVAYICDLMVENKKVKFGLNVTSSEKVDKAQRYADFTLLSIPYPGCEFFKEYKERDYTAEGLVFNWKQDYVDAPLSIPVSLTQPLSIDWSEYQNWDLVQQTQNYLKLLISIINSDDDGGLLVHCISGWDRTPLFISLLRLSLWAAHVSGSAQQRRGKQRDRGSTTSLSSDFSLVMENSPGAAGSFTYEAVELMLTGPQTQASWRKNCASSPQSVLWNRTQQPEERLPAQGTLDARSSSSSSSNHSESFSRLGSSPLEVPKARSADLSLPGSSISTDFGSWQLVTGSGSIQEQTDSSSLCSFPDELPNSSLLVTLTERESRLEEVRSAFLATYNSTVGLKLMSPSSSGAIGGLLEQFVRGVGLRGSNVL